MKKTNFVVVFWLLIALISFVVFLMNFYSLFESVSYILFPANYTDGYYSDKHQLFRDLIKTIPMLLIVTGSFVISLKQGLKAYETSNTLTETK
ncbi:hypothetical protein [Vagococcus xieshaowenii]|uniref:Uncharacterized protein n=1 Tax=Vagococcus xieshaowenii TaxID=2562451 RepID=A0AAJ5JLX3_9ENTE|nr:hypothetical protein [Vagococcus xieshaowenii]QCA28758.1 hypothetical protein E4Z98_05295 [Vagococcus xieshaowenii]TFZ43040.1 hypothetical protein E4031_01350 [Vagococcus xieshaowenii]